MLPFKPVIPKVRLKEKCDIYANGCLKRGCKDKALYYNDLAESCFGHLNDFMFELTKTELEDWRSQIVTSWGGAKYFPKKKSGSQ